MQTYVRLRGASGGGEVLPVHICGRILVSEEATFMVNKLYQLGGSAFGVIHPFNRYSLKVSTLPGLGNKDQHTNHQDRIAWVYSLDVCV